jgi:hypothetical protein
MIRDRVLMLLRALLDEQHKKPTADRRKTTIHTNWI